MITHQQRCIRRARFLLSLVTFLVFGQVYALGLGKLKVLSALDEPLVAEIQLNAVTDDTLESLEISLGSAEDFERAGIDRMAFLKQLEFRIRKVGNPAIRINTTQPAKEPFLHFLIRAEWSDGKLVREYTALLDPPLYTVQQPTVVSIPTVMEEAEQTSTDTSMQPSATTESVPAFPLQQSTLPKSESASDTSPRPTTSAVSEFSGAEYGLTERGDTLWDIASRLDLRGYDVNIFQIMIALQKENPGAFEAGNINRLKVGQILRLSDTDAITSISVEDASQDYTAQLEQWEAYKLALAEASDVLKVPAQDTTAGAVSAIESAAEAAPSPATSTEIPSPTTAADEPAAEVSEADTDTPTQAAAEAEVAEAAAVTSPEATETAETEASSAETATTEQDLLKIVRATLEQEEGEATAAPDSQAQLDAVRAEADTEISALRDQIATIEEALVSSELQNKQLQERITLLEGQVENAQRLVDLENEELALAQKQAAEAQQQALDAKQQAEQQMAETQKLVAQAEEQMAGAEQQATQQAEQKIAAAEQQAAQKIAAAEQQAAEKITQAEQQAAQQVSQAEQQATQQIQQAEQQALQAQQQAEQQTAPVVAAQPTTKQDVVEPITSEPEQAVQPVVQKPSKAWWENLLDMLVGSSITVIAAVVGILVLLVSLLLIIRRRRSIAEFEESILTGSALDGQTETTETEATGTGTDTSFLSDFGMAGMGTMQADEVDPLAEAEVYLAYGRDEQAEEVLKEAAARDASRHELKLKLLEIYQQRNDLNSFETLAEELYPAGEQGDAAAWAKVAEMGLKMNPDNPLFSQEVPAAVTQSLTESLPATVRQALNEPADSIEPAEETLVDQPAEQVVAAAGSDDLIEMPESDDVIGGATESLEDMTESLKDMTESLKDQTASLAADTDAVALSDDSAALPKVIAEPAADTLDPALSPFPAPDQNAGLDEELDRLSQQMEETSASMAAEETELQKSSSDADMLNFATTDPSELEFDIDLDDAETAPSAAPAAEAAQQEPAPLEQAAGTSGDDDLANLDLELAEEPEVELTKAQQTESKDTADEEFLNLDFGEVGEPQPEAIQDEEVSFELEPAYGDDLSVDGGDNGEDTSEKWDEAATKLDLAQAYLNMGDKAGARSIIDEVMKEGSPAQKNQAAELAAQIN